MKNQLLEKELEFSSREKERTIKEYKIKLENSHKKNWMIREHQIYLDQQIRFLEENIRKSKERDPNNSISKRFMDIENSLNKMKRTISNVKKENDSQAINSGKNLLEVLMAGMGKSFKSQLTSSEMQTNVSSGKYAPAIYKYGLQEYQVDEEILLGLNRHSFIPFLITSKKMKHFDFDEIINFVENKLDTIDDMISSYDIKDLFIQQILEKEGYCATCVKITQISEAATVLSSNSHPYGKVLGSLFGLCGQEQLKKEELKGFLKLRDRLSQFLPKRKYDSTIIKEDVLSFKSVKNLYLEFFKDSSFNIVLGELLRTSDFNRAQGADFYGGNLVINKKSVGNLLLISSIIESVEIDTFEGIEKYLLDLFSSWDLQLNGKSKNMIT